MTPLERHLRKWMEKAIIDFGMIAPGDRVAVAVSGGKDSLALMHLLRGPFVHATKDFSLEFIHIHTGFPGDDPQPIADWAASQGVTLRVVDTDIYSISTGEKKRVCYLCSRARRKHLIETATAIGCNKIALGHHRDDVIETFLMNIFLKSEISCMMPDQPLFDGEIHLIRPLYYIRDRLTRRFAREHAFPELAARCPSESTSKREFVRNLIATLEKERPTVRDDIFNSQFRLLPNYIPKSPNGNKPPETPPRI
jgi:tRNA 2-thiocytidine biosynthesis protein TtcA